MNPIVLVRHGEPDIAITDRISGAEIASFLSRYDAAPLHPASAPSDALMEIASGATIVCSDLPRSVASARRCGVSPQITDALFAESIPPHFRSRWLRLRPKSWLILSRMLWMAGFSRHGESLASVRTRADRAAGMLADEATRNRVVLFGHGLFNIMIAKALKKYGYEGPRVPARAFWEYGVYRRNQ